MSGFEENPFGEPTINDPFSDPSVRKATSSTPANRGIEDYNPFADQGSQGTSQVRGAANPPLYGGIGATQQPATLQPTQETPAPVYSRTPQQNVVTSPPPAATLSPNSAEAEWRARRQQEDDLRNNSYYIKRNNWPPLPESCCVQPCFYQDIDVEIHADFQKIVRQLYYLWMFHECILVMNIFGGLLLIFTKKDFSIFGVGIMYLILFTPFSFLCWFRPAYKAFKNDSSINFMAFFFMFFFQLICTSIFATGLPSTCGLFVALSNFDSSFKGVVVGTVLLFVALCFIVAAIGDFLLITKIHRIYRNSEASIQKAQQEFTTQFMRNEHVQSAAGNIAASAVRQQMANATQPRY